MGSGLLKHTALCSSRSRHSGCPLHQTIQTPCLLLVVPRSRFQILRLGGLALSLVSDFGGQGAHSSFHKIPRRHVIFEKYFVGFLSCNSSNNCFDASSSGLYFVMRLSIRIIVTCLFRLYHLEFRTSSASKSTFSSNFCTVSAAFMPCAFLVFAQCHQNPTTQWNFLSIYFAEFPGSIAPESIGCLVSQETASTPNAHAILSTILNFASSLLSGEWLVDFLLTRDLDFFAEGRMKKVTPSPFGLNSIGSANLFIHQRSPWSTSATSLSVSSSSLSRSS